MDETARHRLRLVAPDRVRRGTAAAHRVVFVRGKTADELRELLRRESVADVHGYAGHPALREAMEKGWLRRNVGLFYEVRPDP